MKLGVLGGGQLARMLALSAHPLGIDTVCFEPVAATCANDVCTVINASFDDLDALKNFAEQVDCITFETENIPLATAELLAGSGRIFPSIDALAVAQDRLQEKQFFQQHGIETARFSAVDSLADLEQAVSELGLPAILKTRRFGYDGKGQFVLKQPTDVAKAWQELQGQALILEQFVAFDCEYSLVATRAQSGEISYFPLAKNYHQAGILRHSLVGQVNQSLQNHAQQLMEKVLTAFDYVGTLTIEFFCCGEQLIANEMAPRVHNSGHWSIDGAVTSQFEQHVRALFALPLGSTEQIGQSLMVNCIGNMLPRNECLAIPGVHYHDYRKAARANRKVGHVNLVELDANRFTRAQHVLLELSEK